MNNTNPNLNLTQKKTSNSLLTTTKSKIQKKYQQNYPQKLKPKKITITSKKNLHYTTIYHNILTKYSSQQNKKINKHIYYTIKYTFLLKNTLTPNSPYPTLQPQIIHILLQHHTHYINI